MNHTEKRQAANRRLVELLGKLVEAWPDARFGQALEAFGFNAAWHEEPMETVKLVEKRMRDGKLL